MNLSKIKFDDAGMGSLSAKAIRNILPLMSNGNNITAKAKLKVDSLINLNSSEEEIAKLDAECYEFLLSIAIQFNASLLPQS